MIMLTIVGRVAGISGSIVHQWEVSNLMDMDYMIWQGMYMNLVRTGIIKITIEISQLRIR